MTGSGASYYCVLAFPQHPLRTDNKKQAALIASKLEAKLARSYPSDPLYDSKESLLWKKDSELVVRQMSNKQCERSSVRAMTDLANRVANELGKFELNREREELSALREKKEKLKLSELALTSSELQDQSTQRSYALSQRDNTALDDNEDYSDLTDLFNDDMDPKISQSIMNSIASRSNQGYNKPLKSATDAIGSYVLGNNDKLAKQAQLRDGLSAIFEDKDNLANFVNKGGLNSSGHFINIQSAINILLNEAMLPSSAIRSSLFDEVSKGNYKLKSDWINHVPHNLKDIFMNNSKWCTIFKDPDSHLHQLKKMKLIN
jgi:hypothetical protein